MASDFPDTNNDVNTERAAVQDRLLCAGSTKTEASADVRGTSGLSEGTKPQNSPPKQNGSSSSLHVSKHPTLHKGLPAWHRESRSLGLGEVCRYTIKYTALCRSTLREFYFRIKNMEKTGLRAIHLVNGPFILYCHIVPWNYSAQKRFEPDCVQDNNEVCFKNTIKPGQTFNVRMELNGNSLVQENSDGSCTYGWHCDVISQVVLNRRASILYTLMIGDDLQEMRRVNRSALTALAKGDFAHAFDMEREKKESERIKHVNLSHSEDEKSENDEELENNLKVWKDHLTENLILSGNGKVPNGNGNVSSGNALNGSDFQHGLTVECQTTDDIWNRKPQRPGPIHLVIITHGIFSNLTADMLFLRDSIMNLNPRDNFLVDGFRGNAGRTEKGIRRLGTGVANYTVQLIEQLENDGHEIRDISFVGHSLGGPVQLYALKHILESEKADYFERKNITPKHFVCMASPMLGILSEMSLLILWFLDLGTLGKTGRDLTLLKKLPVVRRDLHKSHWGIHSSRPLLETLPDEPVASLLKTFHTRTVYANAINDGIVPLRTSALLYLDWEAIGNIRGLKDEEGEKENEGEDDKKEKGGDTKEKGGDTKEKEVDTKEKGGDKKEKEVDAKEKEVDDENDDEKKKKEDDDEKKAKIDDTLASSGSRGVGQIPEELNVNVAEKYTTFLARIFNLDFDRKPPHKRKMRNRIKRYAKISVKSSDMHEADHNSSDTDAEMGEVSGDEENESTFNIPPKASAVESALNSMICPIPSRDYINDPGTRKNVIFHDKYYHFQHVPKENPKTGNFNKFFRYHDWRMDKQVKIAAKYHGPKLSWRKVLVKLPPDAHNNIVVRRRFANGYGWGVVDHLKNEIFMEDLKAKF